MTTTSLTQLEQLLDGLTVEQKARLMDRTFAVLSSRKGYIDCQYVYGLAEEIIEEAKGL
jgi:hypothetical protein